MLRFALLVPNITSRSLALHMMRSVRLFQNLLKTFPEFRFPPGVVFRIGLHQMQAQRRMVEFQRTDHLRRPERDTVCAVDIEVCISLFHQGAEDLQQIALENGQRFFRKALRRSDLQCNSNPRDVMVQVIAALPFCRFAPVFSEQVCICQAVNNSFHLTIPQNSLFVNSAELTFHTPDFL